MAKRGVRSKPKASPPTCAAAVPVYLGFDPRELLAFAVSRASVLAVTPPGTIDLCSLSLAALQQQGLYTRPLSMKDGSLWDDRSDAPMSTEFAISRFFVPLLCDYHGWAIFLDGDVLARRSLANLLALADPQYAVQVVQHPPLSSPAVKKVGQLQTRYLRKNWSSVMLFNCGHPAHQRVTRDLLNTAPGRDLHRFCWLEDAEIGAVPPVWNYLAGISPPMDDPAIVHYTLGTPQLPGHAQDPFAAEWFGYARQAGYPVDVALTTR